MLQQQLALRHHDGGLGLALVCRAGHACDDVIVVVGVNDDAILAELLLYQDDLCHKGGEEDLSWSRFLLSCSWIKMTCRKGGEEDLSWLRLQ